MIDAYNERTTIDEALTKADYRKDGLRWIRPGGQHKSVSVKDGRSFHHHTADPMHDDYWHRPFDFVCKLQFGGDCKEAVRALAEEMGLNRAAGAGGDADLATDKPEIDAGCEDAPKVTRAAWAAIRQGNDPKRLFRFGGRVVRTENGDEGELLLQDITLDRMRYELSEAASWFRWGKEGRGKEGRGKEAKFVKTSAWPGDKVVRNVLATPDIDLPCLTRIVEAPVFGPDGSLLTAPGFHSGSRTYYAPAAGLTIPALPDRPDSNDVASARDLLSWELLGDFPFCSDSERAHALAFLLLPFARDLIDGATPLHLVEKPQAGTGATLLVDLLAFPATGHPINAMTEARDEDEWRKRITAALRSGLAFLVIDNLKRRLDSAAVSSAITAPTWTDRLLGSSVIVKTPVRCVWGATGNNPAVSSEIARRTIRIRLDAKLDRPWLRTGFRHPDIRAWAKQTRGQLIWAALVLIRAWIAAGKPRGSMRLGMFESWSEIMGGIMDAAGLPGFLANLNEFYEETDAEGAAIREFIATWWLEFKDKPVTTADLYTLAVAHQIDLIPMKEGNERTDKMRLGRFIGSQRDRVFTIDATEADQNQAPQVVSSPQTISLKVTPSGSQHNVKMWNLVRMGVGQ